MRIALVNSTRPWGGGERWHLDMARRLLAAGHDVWMLVHPRSELLVRARGAGIPVETAPVHRLSGLSPLLHRRLVRLFRERGPEAVIFNGPADLKSVAPAARRAGIPALVYRRGSALPIRNTRLNRWIYGRLVDRVIVNSEATARSLVAHAPDMVDASKVAVIHNSLDETWKQIAPKAHTRREGEPVRIGCMARLIAQKGLEDLISLSGHLKDAAIPHRIEVAGSGRDAEALEAATRDAGASDDLRWLGHVNDVKPLLQSWDLFAFPSRGEGFGYAMAEAGATGLPVVAYRVSSAPEVVMDGTTGILVDAGDTMAFHEAVARLAREPGLAAELGAAARDHVIATFDADRAMHAVLAVLEEARNARAGT